MKITSLRNVTNFSLLFDAFSRKTLDILNDLRNSLPNYFFTVWRLISERPEREEEGGEGRGMGKERGKREGGI